MFFIFYGFFVIYAKKENLAHLVPNQKYNYYIIFCFIVGIGFLLTLFINKR